MFKGRHLEIVEVDRLACNTSNLISRMFCNEFGEDANKIHPFLGQVPLLKSGRCLGDPCGGGDQASHTGDYKKYIRGAYEVCKRPIRLAASIRSHKADFWLIADFLDVLSSAWHSYIASANGLTFSLVFFSLLFEEQCFLFFFLHLVYSFFHCVRISMICRLNRQG